MGPGSGDEADLLRRGAGSRRSAIRSQTFALARRSARSFSAETLRAVWRNLMASCRYPSALLLKLVIGSYWLAGRCAACLANPIVRQAQTNLRRHFQTHL